MRRILIMLLLSTGVPAQDSLAIRGRQIFQVHCSVPYCHGVNGTAGRAPKLMGHKFKASDLFDVVAGGIPNTGMPAFMTQLKAEEIEAVVAYVMTLNASASDSSTTNNPTRLMPPEVERGRALFFDSVRMGGCGKCHELEHRGSAVAQDIKIGVAPLDFRSVPTNTVVAHPTDEAPFPVLVVERSQERVRVFDLSSRLPVLRSFKPDGIKLTPGSAWQHSEAVGEYTDLELRSIEAYVRWASEDK